MRKLIALVILLLLAAALAWAYFSFLPSLARDKTVQALHDLGFKQVEIASFTASPSSLSAENITLEETKIDHIEYIKVDAGWWDALTGNTDDAAIIIDGIDIYRVVEHVYDLQSLLAFFQRHSLLSLPDGALTIRNARLNVDTGRGVLQFVMTLSLSSADEDGKRTVNAKFTGNQPTLAFGSSWQGWVDGQGDFILDADIPDISSKIGAFRLSRGNGWMSLRSNGAFPVLSGQLEAGATSLMDVPLQNFSLTLNLQQDVFTLLMRANTAGSDDNLLTVDINLQGDTREAVSSLSVNELGPFLTYLEEYLGKDTAPLRQAFGSDAQLFLSGSYEIDKRFPGGPYPFDLTGTIDDEDLLTGTFLLYPQSFDTRGSVEITGGKADVIHEFFNMKPDNISGNYLRLDGSLADLLGIGAGIESDTGEGP